jgi:hypothetical protein
MVAEVEPPAADKPKGKSQVKVLQLRGDGDKPVVHAISPEAGKKLKEHLGKLVRVRAYVAGDRIEAVDAVAVEQPAK